MSNWGRETATLVAIDQPFCIHTFGDAFHSPVGSCTALLGLTGDRKCFQCRANCHDPANYNPETLTLLFGFDQKSLIRYFGNVIPSLRSYDTTPALINLAALDESATVSALGQREVVTLRFDDHRYADVLVDKYRLERSTGEASAGSPSGEQYDPYERGTFWGKWLARNPYYVGYPLRVYQGYVGDTLEEMRVRHYIIDRIDGPNNGQVTIVAKDLFAKIEALKAVAPKASRGELSSAITGTPGSFTVTPADIIEEDYPHNSGSPSELFVAIGKEIIRCARTAATFSILQRACFNTEQEDHEQQDSVQLVLVYSPQLSHEIVYDLFTNYGGIDAAQIDLEEWETLAATVTRNYAAVIAKPTPVYELAGELMRQAGFTLWPDVSANMVRYAAFRPASAQPTLTDRTIIAAPNKRQPSKRVSQVWVRYALVNPLESNKEAKNYRSRVVVADLESEGTDQYGTPQIREVFGRWIQQFDRQNADECGQRIGAMFRDPPLESSITVPVSRAEEFDIAAYFNFQTAEVQDDTGAQANTVMAPVSFDRGENELVIGATQVTFSGEVTDRTIYIENNASNLVLRDIYDSLYSEIPEGSPTVQIEFVVTDTVLIGSGSTSEPALRTGVWPVGVVPRVTNLGRWQGKGGDGGNASSTTGGDGQPGGPAFIADSQVVVDNTDGEIWGGAGGGGAGVSGLVGLSGGESAYYAGSGGGAGQGQTPSVGGAPSAPVGATFHIPGSVGGNSTTDTAGVGGTPGFDGTGRSAGRGGDGGAPGAPGSNGGPTVGVAGIGAAGTGGAAGNAIQGVANITFAGSGDIRGAQV